MHIILKVKTSTNINIRVLRSHPKLNTIHSRKGSGASDGSADEDAHRKPQHLSMAPGPRRTRSTASDRKQHTATLAAWPQNY